MQGIDEDKPDDKRTAFNSRVVGGWKGAGGRVMVFEISHVIHFKRKEVTIHKEHHVPADGAVCAVSITQIKRASVTNRGFKIRGAFLFFGFGT